MDTLLPIVYFFFFFLGGGGCLMSNLSCFSLFFFHCFFHGPIKKGSGKTRNVARYKCQ